MTQSAGAPRPASPRPRTVRSCGPASSSVPLGQCRACCLRSISAVKLVRGRFFDGRDAPIVATATAVGGRAVAPRSIIVDETLAKRFWPTQDPIGRRMYFPNDIKDLTAITPQTAFMTVVGIIGDIKLHDLTEGKKSVGAYYFSTDQDTSSGLTFAVKTAGDPLSLTSAVRNALGGLDRELPVFDIQTMDQRMDKSLVSRRSTELEYDTPSGIASTSRTNAVIER